MRLLLHSKHSGISILMRLPDLPMLLAFQPFPEITLSLVVEVVQVVR